MLLDLDDDQYAFADVLDAAMRRHAGPGPVRALYDGPGAEVVAPLDEALRGLGVPGLTVAEAHGGSGLAVTDTVLVTELLGRHLVAPPVAELVGIVAPLLARWGDAELLSRVAAGELRATVQDGWSGWGPWASDADLVAVVLDDRVVLAAPDPEHVERLASTDRSRRLGRVLPGARTVAELGQEAATEARRRAVVSSALQLTGVAVGMIELATEYAKVRTQFGRPVGAFQAVKHLLADALVAVESSRRTAWWAALCLDDPDGANGADAAEAVSVAKATIGEAARTASSAALQVHGGIGYTWECDLHFWMKRAQALQGAWGSTDAHLAALGDLYALTPR